MAQKAVELILMRQLASYLAVPIFLVDPEGNLLYYNEPAERLLGRRYDETGEMPLAEWSTVFTPTAEDGSPLRPEELPLVDRPPEAAARPPHARHPGPRRRRPAHRRRPPSRSRAGRAPPGRRRDLLGGAAVVKLTLWGTRGSAGRGRARDGAVRRQHLLRRGAGRRRQLLVLDAGTGIRRLGAALAGRGRRVDILLTHLHMDHIQGLGFFAPFFEQDREVHLWGPPSTTLDLRERLTRYLSPPLFPVRLRELPCRLVLHDVPLEGFEIGPFRVSAALVCHPGPTVGYRIAADGATLAYLPDHEPALGLGRMPAAPDWISGFALAAGADVLIHDAQYSAAEYVDHVGWGHSALTHTLALGDRRRRPAAGDLPPRPGARRRHADSPARRGVRGRRLPVRDRAGDRGSVH